MNSQQNPLISIVIATYNSEATLHDCLKSIQNIYSKQIELIIIDGKSNDQTLAIIHEYADIVSQVISEPDNGIYDALNKGVKAAKGSWLYFLGSDDQLEGGFKDMIPLLLDKNTLYYGDCITTNPSIFLGGYFSRYRMAKSNICHHAVFYPRYIFEKYTYEIKYKVYADHVLNIKIWGDNLIKKKYYPIIIAKYSLGGYSSKNDDFLFDQNKLQLIKNHLGMYAYLRYHIKLFKKSLK